MTCLASALIFAVLGRGLGPAVPVVARWFPRNIVWVGPVTGGLSLIAFAAELRTMREPALPTLQDFVRMVDPSHPRIVAAEVTVVLARQRTIRAFHRQVVIGRLRYSENREVVNQFASASRAARRIGNAGHVP